MPSIQIPTLHARFLLGSVYLFTSHTGFLLDLFIRLFPLELFLPLIYLSFILHQNCFHWHVLHLISSQIFYSLLEIVFTPIFYVTSHLFIPYLFVSTAIFYTRCHVRCHAGFHIRFHVGFHIRFDVEFHVGFHIGNYVGFYVAYVYLLV